MLTNIVTHRGSHCPLGQAFILLLAENLLETIILPILNRPIGNHLAILIGVPSASETDHGDFYYSSFPIVTSVYKGRC